MKKNLVLLFLSCAFFYQNISALTIVAKVNPRDNSLYLDENDPHREKIIAILQKYRWPSSLMNCTDEERHEIFKDKIPFSETVFIQNKVREITENTSYIALWIPPMVSQAYVMYLFTKGKIFERELFNTRDKNEKWYKIAHPEFYKTTDIEAEYIPFFIDAPLGRFSLEKKREDKKKTLHAIFKEANSLLQEKNGTNEPYLWFYSRSFLSYLISEKLFNFEKILHSETSPLLLPEKNAQEIFTSLISHVKGSTRYTSMEKVLALSVPAIQKEYEAAKENMTLFSRASNAFDYTRYTDE